MSCLCRGFVVCGQGKSGAGGRLYSQGKAKKVYNLLDMDGLWIAWFWYGLLGHVPGFEDWNGGRLV